MQLSKNFKLSEFTSGDNAFFSHSALENLPLLVNDLEVIREALGNNEITITSGFRSEKHNKKEGGSTNSYHMLGMAADFKVKGVTPSQVRSTIYKLMENGSITLGGVGSYNSFTHFDIRGVYRFWKQ